MSSGDADVLRIWSAAARQSARPVARRALPRFLFPEVGGGGAASRDPVALATAAGIASAVTTAAGFGVPKGFGARVGTVTRGSRFLEAQVHGHERVSEGCQVCVSTRRVSGECLQERLLQIDVAALLSAGDLDLSPGVDELHDLGEIMTWVGHTSVQKFEERGGQRVLIRIRRGGRPREELRCHVSGGPEEATRGRCKAPTGLHAGDSEVAKHGAGVGTEKHVGRLHVSMYNLRGVGGESASARVMPQAMTSSEDG